MLGSHRRVAIYNGKYSARDTKGTEAEPIPT